MQTVFVSHSSEDRGFVEGELVPLLHSRGVRTWFCRDDIRPASPFPESILLGLQSQEWFLVVASPDAADSEWVKYEVHWAMENRRGRVVPVLLRDCELARIHLGLPLLEFVDFRGDRESAYRALLDVWSPPPGARRQRLWRSVRRATRNLDRRQIVPTALLLLGLAVVLAWRFSPRFPSHAYDVHCTYTSNYPQLLIGVGSPSPEKRTQDLKATVSFRNVSGRVLRRLRLEIYVKALTGDKSIVGPQTVPKLGEYELAGRVRKAYLDKDGVIETGNLYARIPQNLKTAMLLRRGGGLQVRGAQEGRNPEAPAVLPDRRPGSAQVSVETVGEGKRAFADRSEEKEMLKGSGGLELSRLPEDVFAGFVGLGFQIFLRYEVDDFAMHVAYFGGSFYESARYSRGPDDGVWLVRVADEAYDYLSMFPKAVAVRRESGRSRIVDGVDDVEHKPGEPSGRKLTSMGIVNPETGQYLARIWMPSGSLKAPGKPGLPTPKLGGQQ